MQHQAPAAPAGGEAKPAMPRVTVGAASEVAGCSQRSDIDPVVDQGDGEHRIAPGIDLQLALQVAVWQRDAQAARPWGHVETHAFGKTDLMPRLHAGFAEHLAVIDRDDNLVAFEPLLQIYGQHGQRLFLLIDGKLARK
jgi:hypothetical protein